MTSDLFLSGKWSQ